MLSYFLIPLLLHPQHVRRFLDEGPCVEYVPTMDFFFRHNKPFFWLTDVWVPFGNHPIFRWDQNQGTMTHPSAKIAIFSRYLFGYTLPYNYGLLKLINDKIMPKGLTNNFVVQVRRAPINNSHPHTRNTNAEQSNL